MSNGSNRVSVLSNYTSNDSFKDVVRKKKKLNKKVDEIVNEYMTPTESAYAFEKAMDKKKKKLRSR
jgi:hypothetical protein